MKIVVPYTRLRDETVAALAEHAVGHSVVFQDVSGSDEAMWEMWAALWREREDVVVVEHDIVVHAAVVPEFAACAEPWCTFAYPYAFGNDNPYHGTGCVRFRGELMEAVPDLWARVAAKDGPHHPPKHWCSLDGFSQLELWQHGFKNHRHEPPVGHVDPSNSHGCLGTF